MLYRFFLGFLFVYLISFSVFADTIENPCGGPSAFLNIIDRPTVGDSPCVVPSKKSVLETGYEYQSLHSSSGHQQNFPESELRLGIPASNELVLLLPNYIHQSINPSAGFGATTLGIKHEIGYNKNWIGTIESLFTLPTGSDGFGSNALGVAINGIVGYAIKSNLNINFMFGGSTQTQSAFNDGERYTSFNPDIVFTYIVNPKVNCYAEVYGQTQAGPEQGGGYNFDGGFVFLPLQFLSMDLEFAQRINGSLGGFNHYFGAGMSFLFS